MDARWVTGILLAAVVVAVGQEAHQHGSGNEERLGDVTFPVSCAPEVQKPFERGVALLHSFAYAAAEKQFVEIARTDEKCAMAHWGMAMSYYHQLWEPRIAATDVERGQREMETAQRMEGTAREREYIAALGAFYRDAGTVKQETRAEAYAEGMAQASERQPKDVEAQIFQALALLSTASPRDRSRKNQKRAAEILEPLYKQYPQHPGIAHYLIHAYDNPELASRGLPAARAYAQIAPAAPHALHMPSHIFTQLGLWDDSIRSNQAARDAAHGQGDVGEELHAMDYLEYAYLQAGKNEEALKLREAALGMKGLAPGDFKAGYAAAAIPVRYAMERGAWAEAGAIEPRAESLPQVAALSYWGRAVGFARSGKTEAAEHEVGELQKCLEKVRAAQDEYWAAQVEIQLSEARGWIAYAKGQTEEAAALLRKAAEQEDGLEKRPITPGPMVPAREQLGELLLESHQPREALREFEKGMANAPRRRGALSGAARAAEMAGERTKAEGYRKELNNLSTERAER